MFEGADMTDIFRGSFPYLLLTVPTILIICAGNPVLASSEFSVYRMSQFDVNGLNFGCRSSALSLEAKSIYTWSTKRHCIITKFQDLTVEQFRDIRQKAGGLVILLPKDVANLNSEEKEYLCLLEQAFMEQPITIPVYFSTYNSDLDGIINDITRATSTDNEEFTKKRNVQRKSALSEMMNSISANGYQTVVTEASHESNKNTKIPIIQGELSPTKLTKFTNATAEPIIKLQTIIVAAHLNTFGIYNDYPLNADAAVLLSLADFFGKLYNTSNAPYKYRILFLLTESGPLLNYQGVKKWLDENVQLQNVEFVLCLDSITQSLNGDGSQLFMHVSRPPKEKSPISIFFKHLKEVSLKYGNITVEGVHKKINLAEPQLAWEHERFSIKRLSSFTLSSLKLPKHPTRTSIFKDNEEYILAQTKRNAKVIGEALARYVYTNIALDEPENFEIFSNRMELSNEIIKSYINIKSSLHNNDLRNAFEKYLTNVKLIYEKPDSREPDFMLYEGSVAVLNVYRVKPAAFDLVLTIIIFSYLCSAYFFINSFPAIYEIICKLSLKPEHLSPLRSQLERKTKTN
ncbi:BOS complex subunit NCLN [Cochliomyia hominivorax]